MKSYKASLLISIIVICLPALAISQELKRAELKGVVMDSAGSVVRGAKVTMQGINTKLETTTTEKGEYSFHARAEIYFLYIDASTLGFARCGTVPFKLPPDQTSILNFTLRTRNVYTGVYIDSKPSDRFDDIPLTSFYQESIMVASDGDIRSGQMLFGNKKTSAHRATYSTRLVTGKGEDVSNQRTTFSFNLFSVTADAIEVDWKRHLFVARGHPITEENGRRTIYTKPIKFRINNLTVVILNK